jgi:MoaA/NifB/PqqE/SkfB family radical SAM enzyme
MTNGQPGNELEAPGGSTRNISERDILRAQEDIRRAQRFEEYNKVPAAPGVPKVPLVLRIEVVNLCNANCVFCTYQYQKREIETMSFETFKKTVDQFTALGGNHIDFTPVVGDSLIDKGLEEKVAYARQFPQYERLVLWTNAILLTRERFESIVNAGINEFYISASGFTPEEYKTLYRNSNYAKLVKNLTEISQSPALKNVKFLVWARTGSPAPDQDPDYIKLRDLGIPIIFQRDMFSWHGQIKENDLPGNMFIVNPPKDQTKPCFMLWGGFTVMSNGDMTVCGCTDMDGAGLPLGNIRDVPLDAHLRDGRWLKLRDSFIAGTPPEFCRGCDIYWPTEVAKEEPTNSNDGVRGKLRRWLKLGRNRRN